MIFASASSTVTPDPLRFLVVALALRGDVLTAPEKWTKAIDA